MISTQNVVTSNQLKNQHQSIHNIFSARVMMKIVKLQFSTKCNLKDDDF